MPWRALYNVAVHLARPAAVAALAWRAMSNRRHWYGMAERFGHGPPVEPGASGILWVHAVSLGEVSAAAPLLKALRARHADFTLLLTTATLTGRARATELLGDATVRYLPYDTPGAMRRFIGRVRPALLIVMETELWPNLFAECRRHGVSVLLASARLSPRSVARYRRFGRLFENVFAGGVRVAAQTAEDADRFAALGADPALIAIVGNVKFDLAVGANVTERGVALRAAFWPGRPVWIAGSTHAGEEQAVLAAHAELSRTVVRSLLLLVPRHPHRFAIVADLLTRGGVAFERRSQGEPVRADSSVLLVDSVGELADLYAAADIAFVGGSLVSVGGHNLLEPAARGVPIITGPHHSNGAEIARLLIAAGAVLQIADGAELGDVLQRLFTDPDKRQRVGTAGLQVVMANRGSVARLLEIIEPLLEAKGVSPTTSSTRN